MTHTSHTTSPQRESTQTQAAARPTHRRAKTLTSAATLTAAALILSACSGQSGQGQSGSDAKPSGGGSASSSASQGTLGSTGTEQARAMPRLVATYEGGIMTLDAATLKTVKDEKKDGFLRVNPAGDGRHAFVTTGEGFQLLDTGTWSVPHGDHSHYYTAPPQLTPATVKADKAGHVVSHAGRAALYADGSGTSTLLDLAALAKQDPNGEIKDAGSYTAPTAHHGVSVPLEDGRLLTTRTRGEDRVGVTLLDKDLKTEAGHSDQCPSVHGEAAAKGGAVVFGCEGGVLVFRDGRFTLAKAPGGHGRVGTQAGSEASPIVLGDFKVQADGGKREHPTKISLTDTRTAAMRVVDLPASYSFRSLGRAANGDALVLGTDGKLRVIDPGSGRITREIPVTAPWTEPEEWQAARPTLFTDGEAAFVTEPASRKLHRVDLRAGKVTATTTTPQPLNELTGVTGVNPESKGREKAGSHEH